MDALKTKVIKDFLKLIYKLLNGYNDMDYQIILNIILYIETSEYLNKDVDYIYEWLLNNKL